MTRPPLFIVQLDVNPDVEERWNHWYNTEHLPEVMEASSSIISATRYRQTGGRGDLRYAAIYEFDSEAGLEEFMRSERLAAMSAQYDRDWGELSRRTNHSYVPFLDRVRATQSA